MIDSITKIVLTAFVLTGVAIALAPKAQTASVVKSLTGGIVGIQNAATGALRQ